MARRKRSGFGDVFTDRATFERGDARCPSCKRPIGPDDHPSPVATSGGAAPSMMTMHCGRCDAMLTIHFQDAGAAAT